MDLERSLANIKIDENPWRSHEQNQQPWGAPMPGAASGNTQGAWGHMSPQQMRNAWPDPNGQNVNEVLGLGGAQGNSQGWGPPMGPPNDFGDAAKIWSDPHADQQQFQPLHSQHRGMNGMMDAPGDWMGGPSQSQQPMWSDPMKQDAGYWKHQQQQGWNGPPGQMANNAGYRMPHQQHRRGGNGPPMGMHMQMPIRVGPPGGWNPQGQAYQMNRQQQPSESWGSRGGMGQRGMGSGRGYPGVDMSMPPPPPIDMINTPGMPVLSVRQLDNLWGGDNKRALAAAAQGGVPINHFQQMPAPFGLPSKPQQAPNQFPIGGADDLMWHDPNGDLKKWQRDTGVSLWGDPEKCNERPVRNWKIAEGEEEDLEVALSKCPVPQKRNEDGTARLPFTLPSKRPIVVTGWGELPENDPNNPAKSDDMPSSSKWGDMTPVPPSDAPWYLPGGQQPAPFVPDSPAWGQPPGPAAGGGMMPMPMQNASVPDSFGTQQIADQLRYAVDKGYLDMSILSHPTLPTPVLQNMTALLTKIPQLESVENEMHQLVESVRPEGESTDGSPTRWMNEVQKEEYNRLIIDVTTAKIEVRDLSKKINTGLAEAGMGSNAHDGSRAEAYHYSFLE